ncbi:hypothetical protein CEQ51_03660 [Pseudomonas thivervalensis]|uniref:Uncharacterized protein n=1 Tax=Pseudomonas thivervalensis TaxID=86265 RepID=A0A2Z4ZNZ8_9PSED|nr:hypothetical protein CE140_04350 [Pseudomonas thivervalensis]AXA59210.1 hypothetical protein CEQ51_03660 [Pseudomonas thivervalensis]
MILAFAKCAFPSKHLSQRIINRVELVQIQFQVFHGHTGLRALLSVQTEEIQQLLSGLPELLFAENGGRYFVA